MRREEEEEKKKIEEEKNKKRGIKEEVKVMTQRSLGFTDTVIFYDNHPIPVDPVSVSELDLQLTADSSLCQDNLSGSGVIS